MSSQSTPISTKTTSSFGPLARLLHVTISGAIFYVAYAATQYLWSPVQCQHGEDDVCRVNPILNLVGVLITCLVHSSLVAAFAWTGLSNSLRVPQAESTRSAFNTILWSSIAFDIYLWITVLLTVPTEMDEMIQAAVITFNGPALVFLPYVLAALRDRTTDIGSWLHFILDKIQAASTEKDRRDAERLGLVSLPTSTSNDSSLAARRQHAFSPSTAIDLQSPNGEYNDEKHPVLSFPTSLFAEPAEQERQ